MGNEERILCETFKSEKEGFVRFITDNFDELKKQFIDKQLQYGDADPLINFRTGANLQCHDDGYPAMFNMALAYENKHVSHLYNHGIDGKKVEESLKDIAIYSMIELYILHKYKQNNQKKI